MTSVSSRFAGGSVWLSGVCGSGGVSMSSSLCVRGSCSVVGVFGVSMFVRVCSRDPFCSLVLSSELRWFVEFGCRFGSVCSSSRVVSSVVCVFGLEFLFSIWSRLFMSCSCCVGGAVFMVCMRDCVVVVGGCVGSM